MSSTAASGSGITDPQRHLSHFIKRLLQIHGGSISAVQASERAADRLDLDADIESLIEKGESSNVYRTEIDDGTMMITGVSPASPEPQSIAAMFADGGDISALDADDHLIDALRDAGYETCQALSNADPETLHVDINETLLTGGDYKKPRAMIPEAVATDSELDALADAGYGRTHDIARATVDELANASETLTLTKAAEIQEYARTECGVIEQERAEQLIEAAEQALPNTPRLFAEGVGRYTKRMDNGTGSARVTKTSTESTTAGDPLALKRAGIDLETLRKNPTAIPADLQYVSDISANADSPTPTGLTVLEESDHEKIPRPDTHPQAGDDALPTDENGDVIPPAVPVEPLRQLPVDELIAKKLSRGMIPVCLVGPPGSGKNYLFKYLAWATNRGYRSVDVSESTMPEDLFGPLTPDEDQKITPRNGAVKQGLLAGDLVVINEFPAMRAGAATELHRLLNEGKLLVKSHGELIEPHPAARLVVTMNPPGERENRASEPMPRPTRGRFRRYKMPYPQSVDDEVRAVSQQANNPTTVVAEDTLTKIVEFAHKTRQDENDHWPTLSTRNLVNLVCEDIEDGVEPKAAVKGTLWGVSEPYQDPSDAFDTVNDML